METISKTPYSTHVSGAPLTASTVAAEQPGLLRSHIDERITRIRPSSTPIDQISRMVGARQAKSMKVDYYSIDSKKSSVRLTSGKVFTSVNPANPPVFNVNVAEEGVVSPTETVMFPNVAYNTGHGCYPLVCYVDKVDGLSVTLRVVFPDNLTAAPSIPDLSKDALMVRMGRAAGELDVQTSQYSAIPVKNFNYCQIFKAQVEESVIQRLADKEVGWTFSDQEESAIVDMRMGMERSFLFGARQRLELPDGSEVLLTGGIWQQAGREWTASEDELTEKTLNDLMRQAFANGGGSTQKVLLAGSGLIAKLSTLDTVRALQGEEKKVVWGIDFDRITSKFGTLYVKRAEIFDDCNMSDAGIILDPEYVTKYSHIPFKAERISFHKQGLRNTEAVVLTEASCLVLRYPEAHMRVILD